MTKGKGQEDKQWFTLHRLNIEQHEPHQKLGRNSGVWGELAIPAPPVIPDMILLNGMEIIYVNKYKSHK